MTRYVLYTSGGTAASLTAKTAGALRTISGYHDVRVVNKGLGMLLVDISAERIDTLLEDMPGWACTIETFYKRPTTPRLSPASR